MGDDLDAIFRVPELPLAVEKELSDQGGAAVLWLLRQALREDGTDALERLMGDCYDRTWERLHCGSWKGIHRVWRQAFGYACVFKAKCLARRDQFIESLRTLDMCLMMSGPYSVPRVHEMIAAVEDAIRTNQSGLDGDCPTQVKRRRLISAGSAILRPDERLPQLKYPIARIHLPSLDDFFRLYMLTNTPVILTGAMDSWPAMGIHDSSRMWNNLNYFRRVAGFRTIPVEIGSSYLAKDWGQELMTMNEFIDRFLQVHPEQCNALQSVGYLAQHHLFDQIPTLGKDVMTPDYCTLERRDSKIDELGDDDVAVNAWFGPGNTVSPLHFDPKDNLLCQVVGRKYLRLFSPAESVKLYPVEGILGNTSQVDVEDPDTSQFPLFASASYVECVLKEGEMLYIPPRYWHYVRSLSTSFSVSFWWS